MAKVADEMQYVTWNSCNAKMEDIDSWGDQLYAAVGNSNILVQEVKNWDKDGDYRNWQLHKSSAVCKAGILVPSELMNALKWSSDDDPQFCEFVYASGVQIADVGAVSGYFVHSGSKNSDEEFMKGLCEVRSIFRVLVARGVSKLVLGCDLNLQLGSGLGEYTGYNVMAPPKSDARFRDRHDAFMKLCADFDFCVVNTFGDAADKSFTRGHWKDIRDFSVQPPCKKTRFSYDDDLVYTNEFADKPLTQIDYICFSIKDRNTKKILHSEAKAINNLRIGNGDHFPVTMRAMKLDKPCKMNFRENNSGWKWNSQNDETFLSVSYATHGS